MAQKLAGEVALVTRSSIAPVICVTAEKLPARDGVETEIGGFGITPPWDLLLVEEFVTVRQQTSVVSVSISPAHGRQFN